MAWILDAPGLHWGKGSLIRGTQFITFGRNLYVHSYTWIEAVHTYNEQTFHASIAIRDDVSLSSRVHISCIEQIVIESGCLIGSNVYISDHNHGVYHGIHPSLPSERPSSRRLVGGAVKIGRNVWIGDNVVIVGPVTIGDGAIIGANTVVTKDIDQESIVVGIPGKTLKRFDQNLGCWERV